MSNQAMQLDRNNPVLLSYLIAGEPSRVGLVKERKVEAQLRQRLQSLRERKAGLDRREKLRREVREDEQILNATHNIYRKSQLRS
jgi:hypothetical protein